MIFVTIGDGQEQRLDGRSLGWVVQQANRRRQDGVSVCVIIRIEALPDVSISLASPDCKGSGGVPHHFTNYENEIIRLWRKFIADRPKFSGGDLETFLK